MFPSPKQMPLGDADNPGGFDGSGPTLSADAPPASPRPMVRLGDFFSARILLLVGTGGALGTAARLAWEILAQRNPAAALLPSWATVLVNLVGAFLLGVFVALLARLRIHRPGPRLDQWRLFLGTGFLGAFTTYSGFVLALARAHDLQPGSAWGQGVGMVGLGILVAGLGLALGARAPQTGPRSA